MALNDEHGPAEAASLSRRSLVRVGAFATALFSTLGGTARAAGALGSRSNGAVAGVHLLQSSEGKSTDEKELAVKIGRAMLAGPSAITRDATVADMDEHGNLTVLRQGTNHWVCTPGDENKVGSPPTCLDPMALQWLRDVMNGRPKPTNAVPGVAYMLCGATQHSNTDPFDKTSPAIPIGPHWMILWPFDAASCGLPTTVRDDGAWIMFDGTPYAYLHICGTPWVGNEYAPDTAAVWTMAYQKKASPS